MRYFLHVKHNDEIIEDPDGSDLPDLRTAQLEALEAAKELLANAILSGQEPAGESIAIMDEKGRELASVPLTEVLPTSLKKLLV